MGLTADNVKMLHHSAQICNKCTITDLRAGISKNVTNAGSQLSRASLTEVQNRKGAESGLVTTDLLDV